MPHETTLTSINGWWVRHTPDYHGLYPFYREKTYITPWFTEHAFRCAVNDADGGVIRVKPALDGDEYKDRVPPDPLQLVRAGKPRRNGHEHHR